MFLKKSVQNNILKINKKLITNRKYSSLLRRFWGGIIDLLLLSSITITIIKVFHLEKETTMNYFAPALIYIYNIYYMSSEKQATLGYYFAGVRFSTLNGKPITLFKTIVIMIVSYIVIFTIDFVFHQIYGKFELKNMSVIVCEYIFIVIVYITPYFFTKRRQFLVDWLVGVIALKNYVEPAEFRTDE